MYYDIRIGAGVTLRRYANHYRPDEFIVGDKSYPSVAAAVAAI